MVYYNVIKITGTLFEDLCTFMIISLWIFPKRSIFQTEIVEKIKTHFLYAKTFSPKSCRLWDNVEKCGRTRHSTDDNIKRRMRFACCTKKAADTLDMWCLLKDVQASAPRVAHCLFLGAYAKLQKAAVSFMSVWNNSAANGRILIKLDIWAFFENLSGKFSFH